MVEAEAILSRAVDAYRAALGERLVAAYALGSLAHGGFSALVSDVDPAVILNDPVHEDDEQTIGSIAEDQKRSGSALAERLSVFWGTPSTLRGERGGVRFPPLDRLDLIENGRLLAGADARDGLPRPTADELLISGAQFALEVLAGIGGDSCATAAVVGSMPSASQDATDQILDPELLVGCGVRRVTKLVLFPVRVMFTAATGGVATNDAAAVWYLAAAGAPAKALVSAALGWRKAPPADESAAVTLLREQLVPLYLHYIADHIVRLITAGESELAGGFELWRERLTAEAR